MLSLSRSGSSAVSAWDEKRIGELSGEAPIKVAPSGGPITQKRELLRLVPKYTRGSRS
jgi:hypothetical protein